MTGATGDARDQTLQQARWPEKAYAVTKVGVCLKFGFKKIFTYILNGNPFFFFWIWLPLLLRRTSGETGGLALFRQHARYAEHAAYCYRILPTLVILHHLLVHLPLLLSRLHTSSYFDLVQLFACDSLLFGFQNRHVRVGLPNCHGSFQRASQVLATSAQFHECTAYIFNIYYPDSNFHFFRVIIVAIQQS